MTSSFQTIVGKSRDEIPGYGVDNYQRTEPDLTESVNAQINRNQEDTVQFYNEMAEIQKLIAETPMKNLQALATFSGKASEAIGVFRAHKKAQDDINSAMQYLDNNSSAQLYDAEGKLNLENAKFESDLLNENTDASINFLRTKNATLPQDAGIKEILERLHTNYYGARQQFINENGGQDITDQQEFIELHNAADELMVTGMILQAERAGVDTNSREFRKLFYEKIYPDLVRRRENNIQTWKSTANRNYKENRTKNLDKIIISTLQVYDPNSPTQGKNQNINLEQLVETIIETHGGKDKMSPKEAVEYLFDRVANEVGQDRNQLELHHLRFLYDDAIFKHSATGKYTTIADGDFKYKDSLNNLIQDVEINQAADLQRRIQAENVLANEKYKELSDQYGGNIPPGIESEFLSKLEEQYPHFDATKLQSSSRGITNGGSYDGRAGKADPNLEYKDIFEKELVGTEGEPTREQLFEIDRAYGAFSARVANLTSTGVALEEAQRTAKAVVSANLKAGKYKRNAVEARIGRALSPDDINADKKAIQSDIQKIRYQGKFVSLSEQKSLSEYKRFKLDTTGTVEFPKYFEAVTRGTSVSPQQYAEDRFTAMGGYNDQGEIAKRFTTGPDGVLVDTQFGFTQEDLNKYEVKPHLTKVANGILDVNDREKIIKGFKKKGNTAGTWQPNIGFGKNNGDKLTVRQVLEFSNRGASNWGVFGFSSQEVKESLKNGVIDLDAAFDETTQIAMLEELIRTRANRTNSVRGAIIQAEFGGERTVYEGDEGEKRWDRLVGLKASERDLILSIFPALRDAPMNQPQNLLGGVVESLDKIIKQEESKETTDKKIARLQSQIAYFEDILNPSGDSGLFSVRRLGKSLVPKDQARTQLELLKSQLEELQNLGND